MDAEKLHQLNSIGEQAGIGFQLMDDLLDVYADKAKFGKQVGGDIVSNKKTYLLIKALELATPSQKQELTNWLERKEFDVDEKVEAVKGVYGEIGIYELTQEKMNAYYDRAFELLERFEGEEDGKLQLKSFLQKLMKRDR